MGTRPRRRSRRNIQNNSTGTGTDRSCGEIDGATSASIAGTVRLGMLDMGSMSNTTRYGVLIDGRRGGYGVVFPDLPGCY